jgi:hypothetical protein
MMTKGIMKSPVSEKRPFSRLWISLALSTAMLMLGVAYYLLICPPGFHDKDGT